MRLSKIIFGGSTIASVICIIISILLEFCIGKNAVTVYINGIIENVFAGTIVLVFTALFEYHYSKIDTLEKIIIELKYLNSKLYKLEYWDSREFVDIEKYREYFKDEYTDDQIVNMYNRLNKQYVKEQKRKFEDVLKQYIDLTSYDMDSFWLKYRELGFLSDFINKKRNKIYKEVFSYWTDIFNEILEASFHFEEYINSKSGNFEVNKDILIKIQKEIFKFEESGYIKEFTINGDNCYICSYGEDNINGKNYIVGNIVIKHFNDYINYLIKLTSDLI